MAPKSASLPFEAPEEAGPYSVSLHFQQGGSDKVYQLSIEPTGGAFVVNFANGRRGSALASGTKTKSPVDYAEARKICNSKLREQVGKGYHAVSGSHLGTGMAAEAIATAERKSSGYVPQLANPIALKDVGAYICDPDWVFEQKHDGDRRMLIVSNGLASGSNRRGLTVPLTAGIEAAAHSFRRDLVLDGEIVGNTLHVWDLLAIDGVDIRGLTLQERHQKMDQLAFSGIENLIVRTEAAHGAEAKKALYERMKAEGREGIVGKRLSAAYEPGRPNSGGNWFKLKNWNDLSAAVGLINDQRSVLLKLKDEDGNWIEVGSVTIPPNQKMPEIGDVVDARYLYAYKNGALYQAIFKSLRTDIPLDDCRASQRVFKPEEPAPVEEPSI